MRLLSKGVAASLPRPGAARQKHSSRSRFAARPRCHAARCQGPESRLQGRNRAPGHVPGSRGRPSWRPAVRAVSFCGHATAVVQGADGLWRVTITDSRSISAPRRVGSGLRGTARHLGTSPGPADAGRQAAAASTTRRVAEARWPCSSARRIMIP